MRLELRWESQGNMLAYFSNEGLLDPNGFYVIAVYDISRRFGFDKDISIAECEYLLQKYNPNFYYVDYNQLNEQLQERIGYGRII